MNYLKLFEDIGDKVQCKCGWSWNIEKGDKNPYLCHKCNSVVSKSVDESINSKNDSMYSMASLTDLRDSIEFISKYDNMELYEAIEVINKLLDMDLNDVKEWRESLVTNYRKSDLDNFTIELIDKYFASRYVDEL